MKAKICKRCGRCCRTTPPSLLEDDINLVGSVFSLDDVYTIREGEVVWDNLEDKLVVSPCELIKVKSNEEGECIFYEHPKRSCRIYDMRPIQCKEFFCTSPSEFYKLLEKPKLKRSDILKGSNLLRLIEEHSTRCNHYLLDSTIQSIEKEGEAALENLIKMLRYDYELRKLAHERLNIPLSSMDFLFGRPLSDTIRYYGLVLQKEDNSFYLTLSPDFQKVPF